MQKNSITNKITPCCGLPFSVVYWWVSNLTLNSEADRQFILSKISQSGTIAIDGWKVLINSGTLETDASLTKAEFLAWFNCGKQPNCEQLKLIIEGYKMGSWVGDLNEIRFENVLGVLEISDPAPTTVGLYRLSEVGTYTNLGGLVTTAGKINDAYFNGTTWKLSETELPNNVVNNLTSTSTTDSLSSNMGRVLDEKKADKTVATTTNDGLMSAEDKIKLSKRLISAPSSGGSTASVFNLTNQQGEFAITPQSDVYISNKNLFKSAQAGRADVTYGVSEWTTSNIKIAYKATPFEPLTLPAGKYKLMAKIELANGKTSFPTDPRLYCRGFDGDPVMVMKNNADIGQWTTINLTLTTGATLTNIAMTYNGATASTATDVKTTVLLVKVNDFTDNIGSWVASTRRDLVGVNSVVVDSSDVIMWTKNFGNITIQQVGGDVEFDVEANENRLTEIEADILELQGNIEVEKIVAWGDSLTQGSGYNQNVPSGATALRYPEVLSNLIGKPVVNMGVGGEASWQIATRQGAFSIIAEPFTIPATATDVQIVLRGQENDYGFLTGGATSATATTDNIIALPNVNAIGFNPVTISGVEGNLSELKSYILKITSTTHTAGTLVLAIGYTDANIVDGFTYNVPITAGMTPQQIASAIVSNVTRANWTFRVDLENPTNVIASYSLSNSNSGFKVQDAGTTGVVSTVTARANYNFKRLTAGTSKTLNYPTNVITNGAKLYRKNAILIVWMGQNDSAKIGASYIGQGDVKLRYDKMLDNLQVSNKKYIFINHLQGKNDDAWVMKYGSHYINLRKWMCRYGIYYANSLGAGITRTATDIERESSMTNVPPSLKASDDLHYNYWGYQCIARAVYECGVSLGYW